MPLLSSMLAALSRYRAALRNVHWEREIRLWSGLVLFAFVTMHLLNHAIGVLGVPTMEAVQHWRVFIWRSWPGTVALYGAAALHVGLTLKRIALRTPCRMPIEEGLQIVLGLAIPALVLEHALNTRYGSSILSTDDSYTAVLTRIYPNQIAWQTILVLVAWFHGIIGIHYVVRHKPWFERVREIGFALAFSIPLLAIAGFLAAGREAASTVHSEIALAPEQVTGLQQMVEISYQLLIAGGLLIVGALVATEVARSWRGTVPVRYVGHGETALRPGASLLDASRQNRIPHPSLCGGRGRCATCRVLVLSGLETLPEPTYSERMVLSRISAPKNVRLACQIRPKQPIAVQILLPTIARDAGLDWEEEAYKWGVDRNVSILFVDIRAFTSLSKKQLPHDTVLLINRFLGEIAQAVEAHGGRIGMFLSDGVMAIFGLGGQRGMGARNALAAGHAILRAARMLDDELGSALPLPFRVGIGIHCGSAVIARVGDDERGYVITALGETISIASRLEQATKELLADMLVSEAVVQAAGTKPPGSVLREVPMRGHDQPIRAYAYSEAFSEVRPAAQAETQPEAIP